MEPWLKLAGILLGVLARMALPFLRKLRAGKAGKFEAKYAVSAAAAFVMAAIVTMVIFPEFDAGGAGARVKLFCLAFGFGFGFNAIVAESSRWAELGTRK